MLQSFINRLTSKEEDTTLLNESDARTAVAALLVHVAKIDENYTQTEQHLIEAILAHRYELADADASALRIEGEEAETQSVDNFRFTQVIKSGLEENERMTVLEAMWSVVLSDEERDDKEDNLVRRLVEMLGLSPHDSAHARQRVEAAMNS